MMKAFDSIIGDQETGMNKKGLALLKQATTDIEEQLEMIKELKEENEKLKAELNDFTSVFDGNVSMIKMKKENQKLQNEVADLNDENKNIIHELNESSDCNVRMLKMKEENEKLKQGIKDLFLSFD